jgi:hypothetical protein
LTPKNKSTDAAFFQLSSLILAKKSIETIVDFIVRESLNCLNAHRVSFFRLDERSANIKPSISNTCNPAYAAIGMFEEKEVVGTALKERTPILLKTPKDFSDFFKYSKSERKISSLMVIPISFQGKFTSALSAALMDETQAFDEKDLQLLSTFANHACIAMENTFLLANVRKMETSLGAYDQNLKNIQNELQDLAKRETRHIEENISRFIPKTEKEELPDYNNSYSDAFAQTFQMPLISLKGFILDPSLQKAVGEKYAEMHRIIVLENSEGKMKIALAEPTKYLLDELRRITPPRKKLEFFLADPNEVRLCLQKNYNPFSINRFK